MEKRRHEDLFENVPRRAAAALALRAAMRVLPILALRPEGRRVALWFWEPARRDRHILSILQCYQTSVFVNSLTKTDMAAAADAAFTAAYAATAAAAALQHDRSAIDSGVVAGQLLTMPLWPHGVPAKIEHLWHDLKGSLHGLDAGFDIWVDWYENRLQGKPLDIHLEENWAQLSESRLAQKPKDINAYLKTLARREATEPLNRVRAIFIGHGGVGKTSLIRAIRGEKVIEGKEEMTPGVAIQDANLDENAGVFTNEQCLQGSGGLTVHFWDFGGQVMAHATHQFFLREQCLYVIVLDARKIRNANEEAEYWLEHVRAFGKGSPVMLVGNKSDLAPVDLDLRSLRKKYPNVIGFYPLSCTKARGRFRAEFKRFDRDFKEQLTKLGIHAELFTKAQFEVLRKVQEKAVKGNFLSRVVFGKICKESGLASSEPGGREALLDLFDKLGVIMHFPKLPFLKDFVLNPRWLTYGVYKILYSDRAQNAKGRIGENDVAAILDGLSLRQPDGRVLRFPASRLHHIVDAMVAFGVAYRLAQETQRLVIPALLEPQQPEFDFDTTGAIAFQFDFKGFLPRHVLPKLIVDYHTDIARQKKGGVDVVWQNGVLLSPAGRYKAEALIKADYHERTMDILVRGEDANRYLGLIRDAVLRTLQTMPELPYEEKVRLRPDMRADASMAVDSAVGPVWIAHDIIETAQLNGLTEFPGPDRHMYSLRKVIAGMPLPPAEGVQTGIYVHAEKGGTVTMSVVDRSPGTRIGTRLQIADYEEKSGSSMAQDRSMMPHILASLCLPPRPEEEEAVFAQLPEGPGEALRGVLDELKVWPVGQPIEASFIAGAPELRQFVVETAQEWTEAANEQIRFDFGVGPNYRDHRQLKPSQIRIAFEGKGNWSFVGIDSAGTTAMKNGASLNIGDAAGKDFGLLHKDRLRGVILHELGHALGLEHEHQSPESSCDKEFDWEAIYEWLGGSPNFWSKEQVNHNLGPLARSPRRRITPYDPKSIMHYALPEHMFKNGAKSKCFVSENLTLSKGDQQIIQAAYPATEAKQQQYLKAAGKRVERLLEQSGISQAQAKLIADLAAALVSQSHPTMDFRINIKNVRRDVAKQRDVTQTVTGNDNIVLGSTQNSTVSITRK